MVNAIRYDAWGETIGTGSAGGSAVGAGAWKYQGRLDVSPAGLSTPLYDMSARFYAPGIGAFTSLDSVMGSAQNPLSMNRFLYAHANPATLIDPTGHAALEYDNYSTPGQTSYTTSSGTKHVVNRSKPRPKYRAGSTTRRVSGCATDERGCGKQRVNISARTRLMSVKEQRLSEGSGSWSPPSLDQWMNLEDWTRNWYVDQHWWDAGEWAGWGDNEASIMAYLVLAKGLARTEAGTSQMVSIGPIESLVDYRKIFDFQGQYHSYRQTLDTWLDSQGISGALPFLAAAGAAGGGSSGPSAPRRGSSGLTNAGPGNGGAPGTSREYFRGAEPGKPPDFTPREREFRLDKATGFVKTTRGVSVWDSPTGGPSHLEYHRIDLRTVPAELMFVPHGPPGHFEIVPAREMSLTPERYVCLLNQIRCD